MLDTMIVCGLVYKNMFCRWECCGNIITILREKETPIKTRLQNVSVPDVWFCCEFECLGWNSKKEMFESFLCTSMAIGSFHLFSRQLLICFIPLFYLVLIFRLDEILFGLITRVLGIRRWHTCTCIVQSHDGINGQSLRIKRKIKDLFIFHFKWTTKTSKINLQ